MAQRMRTGDGKGWRGEQGMTGVERGFSLGQGILKSVVSVASVYLSVSPFIFHSVNPPLLIYFLIFLIFWIQVFTIYSLSFSFAFLTNFSLSCISLGTCTSYMPLTSMH